MTTEMTTERTAAVASVPAKATRLRAEPAVDRRPPQYQLINVSRVYGSVRALADVSLDIPHGDHIALIGPSGAGKSTLLAMLNGSKLPTEGTVMHDGEDTARMSESRRRRLRLRTSTIYQQLYLVPTLSALHNVLAGRLGHWSLPRAMLSLVFPQDKPLAVDAMEAVGILDCMHTRLDRLSGGQQQRVAIARAIVQQPTALLADEPISAVDPTRAEDIVKLLTALSRQRDFTLVASLHSIDLARRFFGRLIGLRNGRIEFDKPANEVNDDAIKDLYHLDPTAQR